MMRGENAAIVVGFFGREIGGKNAVGASRCGRGGESLEAHLQDGIVIAEEDQRDLRDFANAVNEIENTGERGAASEGAFGGALNRGAVGKWIAEGHAKLDDIGTRFIESDDEFQCGVEGRIAGSDIGDDAKLAGFSQGSKSFVDSRFQDQPSVKRSRGYGQSIVPRASADVLRLFPSTGVLHQQMISAPPAQISAEVVFVSDSVSVVGVEPYGREIKSSVRTFL